MKRSLPIVLLAALLWCGCSSDKTILDEERIFERNVWNRFTPESFSVNVPDAEAYYHINISAAVDTARYRYKEVPLNVILESPNGETRQFSTVVLLEDKGRARGEMKDGYREARARVRSYFSFNHAGKHTLKVGQQTSQYDLEGIHSISVEIETAKIDYSHLD